MILFKCLIRQNLFEKDREKTFQPLQRWFISWHSIHQSLNSFKDILSLKKSKVCMNEPPSSIIFCHCRNYLFQKKFNDKCLTSKRIFLILRQRRCSNRVQCLYLKLTLLETFLKQNIAKFHKAKSVSVMFKCLSSKNVPKKWSVSDT